MPRYQEALALLRELSGPHGIHASRSAISNYRAVFARDAVMAGVAGLLADDDEIAAGFGRTLAHLRDLQGAEGQIASNYEIRDDGTTRVSFGTLAPRLDSASWYLVGVALASRAGVVNPAEFRDSTLAVVRLLGALEYNGRHLIYVPPGGNWADEYICEGYLLYDQALRAWALRLVGALYDETGWIEKGASIERTIGSLYWPEGPKRSHPIAAFSPTVTRDIFDLSACAVLGASGVAPPLFAPTVGWIAERFFGRDELPPAFHPVIDEAHADWPALRRYHLHEFRNRPHEFHNGGVWPIWLGWLALGFARAGRDAELTRLRALVTTRLDSLARYDFEEFLHGLTYAPGGVPQMAYSATGMVFLHLAGSDAQHRLLD